MWGRTRRRDEELREADTIYQERLAEVRDQQAALHQARRQGPAQAVIDAPYRAVSDALDDLEAAAERGHALAVGPVGTRTPSQLKYARGTQAAREWQRRIVAARVDRQAHMLAANPTTAVRQPSCLATDGSVDIGPFWPLLDHLSIKEQPPHNPGHCCSPRLRTPRIPAQRLPVAAPPAPYEGGAARTDTALAPA